jgi:glyoxylase-like metal-dependent hydrolase (beta-lactamase superfamily II)
MNSWITTNKYRIYKVLSGRSNVYLVSKNNRNILIDTGKASAYEKLKRNIEKIKLKDSIDFLILTHAHYSHCQNAQKIKEQFGCKIIISYKEKTSVENGYTQIPKGTTLVSELISKLCRRVGKQRFGYAIFIPDVYVCARMDLLNYGLDIKLIETPGHSDGSISIVVDNEITLVGDAMFGVFKKLVFLPFANDTKEMITSWRKLLDTNSYIFLPGHGGEIKREVLHREYNKNARKHNTRS